MSSETNQLTDQQLFERLGHQDRGALDQLVHRYEGPLFRFVRSLCRNEADAEDALQDTFVSVWRRSQSDRASIDNPRAYLFRAARHAAYRRGRRRVDEPASFDSTDDLERLGAAAGWGQETVNPEAFTQLREDQAAVHRALSRLDEGDREVIVLRDMSGMSGEDAAEALGVSLAAMKSRLHRARLRLMAELMGGAP